MFRNRIPLKHCESLGSYLYRLSNANHYPSISTLAAFIEITVPKLKNNEISSQKIELISKMSGINAEVLYKTSHLQLQELLGEFYHRLILKNKVKYCPLCIRKQSFHKHSWCLIPLNLCMEHKIQLVDCCQGCGTWVKLEALIAGTCNCGFILHNAVYLVETNLDCLVAQSKLYISVFGVEPPSFPFNLNLKHFMNLILHSYHLLDGGECYLGTPGKLKIFNNSSKGTRQNKDQYYAYNTAYWMYQNFPNQFVTVLDAFLENTTTKVMYRRKASFERLFELDGYIDISKAYESYWVNKADQGVVRADFSIFKKKPELLEQRKFISKDEIRTTIGMSYEKIEQLANDKLIELNTFKQQKRKRYQVNRDSFNNIVHNWGSYITRGEAALILGIQRGSITQLIKGGLLKTYNIGSGRYERLSRYEVLDLLNKSRGRYTRKKANGLKLHEALIKYSVNGLSIVKILKFTLGGILRPYYYKFDSLAENIYKINELERCISIMKQEQQVQEGYTLTDVLKILHVGEKKAKQWMNNGVLVPSKVVEDKAGRKTNFFTRNSIEKVRSLIQNSSEVSGC
ncbi:TniQ family protein [Paenibacillus gansuensis]|uniref:TniQ family protein n=1 Tax=Paenibacillus gansuensis TaxID=306542 RepID=A0ABW5PDJ3_9BACL